MALLPQGDAAGVAGRGAVLAADVGVTLGFGRLAGRRQRRRWQAGGDRGWRGRRRGRGHRGDHRLTDEVGPCGLLLQRTSQRSKVEGHRPKAISQRSKVTGHRPKDVRVTGQRLQVTGQRSQVRLSYTTLMTELLH